MFTVKYGTKRISALRGGLGLLPWSGPLFLLAIFALSAIPPFGIFRSEFQIVAGGLGSGNYAAAAVLVVLVTIAFFGLATSATSMLLTRAPDAKAAHTHPDEHPDVVTTDGTHDGAGTVAVLAHRRASRVLTRGEPSAWMVVPVLAGLAVLVLLGVHPPAELTELITRGAAQLGGRHDDHQHRTERRRRCGRHWSSGSRAGNGSRACSPTAATAGSPCTAQVAVADGIDTMETVLPPDVHATRRSAPRLGAAFWYERVDP